MAFQGSLKELPLPDIIQLVSVSGKTGVFVLQNGGERGEIYLDSGQIVHAQVGDLSGEDAVYELAIWPQGEFAFTAGKTAPATTIRKSNTNLLMEAARRIDEWQVLAKKIPSVGLVPVFTSASSTTSVSFTPQEWGLIRKIDERRSIEQIALSLGNSPFETCKVLYGLITSGLVELQEDLVVLHSDRLRRMTPSDLIQLLGRLHREAIGMVAGHPRAHELETGLKAGSAAVEAGRGVEAVLDLIRGHEKVVSAALGPNQAKTFLARVKQIVHG